MGNLLQTYRGSVTCHMGSQSVTYRQHRGMHPALTPAIMASTRFTYPGGM